MLRLTKHWALLTLLSVNIILAIYSTPVIDFGDAGSYIALSHKFLGENITHNMAHRSPLFSIIMAGIIKLFGEPLAFKLTVILNFMLVFLTSWMTFLIFKKLFKKASHPFIIALTFNLSFATIYYANTLLTEILTVFLLMGSAYFMLKFFDEHKKRDILLLGISLGLLSLARFNAIPLIVSFSALLLYMLIFEFKSKLKNASFDIIIFALPCFLILNIWSIFNLNNNGFYGLFPNSGTLVSRNTIVASIDSNTQVSVSNGDLLEIFLKARKNYLENFIKPEFKGSLVNPNNKDILTDLYSGYNIYGIAVPELLTYFKFSDSAGEYELNRKLDGFYKEIAKQNKNFILKLRFYSLLSSFRASTAGSLPESYGKINLNIFPGPVFKVYKLIIPFISLFVLISFVLFFYNSIIKQKKPSFVLLTLFVIIISFWGINFLFATGGDANRFKFPSEPILFGLFFYYVFELIVWIKVNVIKNSDFINKESLQ